MIRKSSEMSRFVRICEIGRPLRRKRPPSGHDLLKDLGVSEAPFQRDLMRDRLPPRSRGTEKPRDSATILPISTCRDRGSMPEVHVLLSMQSLLHQLQPGLIRDQLRPPPEGGIVVNVICGHLQGILIDILRHGPHVEVLRRASLRSAAANAHLQAAVVHALSGRSVPKSTAGAM